MRKYLVNQAQPFGVIEKIPGMGGEGAPATHRNRVSATTEIHNHGMNHAPSFGDKNPGALSHAERNLDHPFAWCGMPKKGA